MEIMTLLIFVCFLCLLFDLRLFIKHRKNGSDESIKNTNTCVCCGAEIPEGRQVCPKCDRMIDEFNEIPN